MCYLIEKQPGYILLGMILLKLKFLEVCRMNMSAIMLQRVSQGHPMDVTPCVFVDAFGWFGGIKIKVSSISLTNFTIF